MLTSSSRAAPSPSSNSSSAAQASSSTSKSTSSSASSSSSSAGALQSAPSKSPVAKGASLVKKPARSSSSVAFGSSTSRSGVGLTRAAAQQQQAAGRTGQSSQSSLLAAGPKSGSRSSIMSDTSASVSSSLLVSGAATPKSGAKSGLASPLMSRASSSLRPPSSTVTSGNVTTTRIGGSATSSISSSSNKTASVLGKAASGALAVSQQQRARAPTLAMTLREKDQQIKLLIKERDEHKFQAELMARKADEWEEKFQQSELEKSHVTSEADDEVVELRRLAQELEDENKRLVEKAGAQEQAAGLAQFKLDELECERQELRRELRERAEQLEQLEQEQRVLAERGQAGAQQLSGERLQSKAKYERQLEELRQQLTQRDEQLMQLRSSLEMRKNELSNLQTRAADLERKLKIESERSERHLKRIDETNLELKATQAKLATKGEENEIYEKQVKQLRQELRAAEEKLEQVSLARKKDVDVLHNKLSAARRGSTTPTSPQPFKTPTPQDELVRLQMEIRDLKDQLIDREAELDCNRRDMELLRRKMETRTLEVDCNNQELARRCQDLLEQNRQSEDTVKQLLKSTTEHSAQLMRATDDLKEANGKCIKLRDEINELEAKLDEQLKKAGALTRENLQLKEENEEHKEQVEMLRQQVDSLNEQLGDLCEQLDVQTSNLHKDREALANQVSQNELELDQLKQALATAKQDLRTNKLQTQEVQSERDRLKADLEMKEKYIISRNDIIETMRHELEDCKKSLAEYKLKIEELRKSTWEEAEQATKEIKTQLEQLKRELQAKADESCSLRGKCNQLEKQLKEQAVSNEEEELKKFDEMRQKHSAELDALKLKLKDLEEQLDEAKSATLKRLDSNGNNNKNKNSLGSQASISADGSTSSLSSPRATPSNLDGVKLKSAMKQKRDDYESQIEFLNSLVVDMQRKCDDYKSRLAQMETASIINEFDNLINSSASIQPLGSRSSTLRRASNNNNNGFPNASGNVTATSTLTRPSSLKNNDSYYSEHAFGSLRPATRISGRPYCDICSTYDLHHTIYCPKVSEKLASRHVSIVEGPLNNNNNNNNDNNNYIGSNNNNGNATNSNSNKQASVLSNYPLY